VNKDGVYEPGIDIPGFTGADQTQWMIMNDVNPTNTQNLYSSNPIGIEVQRTIWAYNRPGALGNTIFVSYTFVNKSGVELDSVYVSQWCDPDLGFAGDDATGCDTTRSLGFVYNGEARDASFANLGLPPPSAGFDFFQGPKVPGAAGDSAIFGGKVVHGYKNLPMTAFDFFINGNATYQDPELHSNGPDGTPEWYNLMRGLISTKGTPFDATVTGGGNYCYPGDPVTGTGPTFIGPAAVSAPADVRMCLCSGPFTMAPGDTQQVVVAALVGLGADYLSSISVLKANDDIAQSAYNAFFQLAVPPPAPVVHVAALDKEIVLSWGDPVTAANTENAVSKGYTFEGYNVYQYPRSNPNGAKLIATYDLIDGIKTIQDTIFSVPLGTYIVTPTEYGTDNGVSHSIDITNDALTGTSIVNNRDYYFSVTAYNYNPTPGLVPHALESSPSILDVRPQSPGNGVRYFNKPGDTLSVTHAGGNTDGFVIAKVTDPSALTGDTYQIGFTIDPVSGNTYWNLTDATKSKTLATNQVQSQAVLPAGANNPGAVITNGVAVQTYGPPPGMNPGGQGVGWNIPSGNREWSALGGSDYGLEGFNTGGTGGAIGMGQDWGNLFGTPVSTVTPDKLHKVLIKFATYDTSYTIAPGDPNVTQAYRYVRHATSALADPSFLPIVNATGGYAYQDRRPVPFTAWDEDNNNQQLDIGFLENNAGGGREDGKYDPPTAASGIDNTSVTREYAFIYATNYNATTDNPALATDMLDNATPMMWLITATMRNHVAGFMFQNGDEFEIIPNYVNTPSITFSFSAKAPSDSAVNQKADIAKINVFPNPYFGFNRLEADKYNRWVRFTHLPNTATIRIFNLAGILVRTLVKSDVSQFTDWDLLNENKLPVAAGMYIAYIDCGSLGTKTLKFAIIPEQQFLDHY
jgi:hypothetical protein